MHEPANRAVGLDPFAIINPNQREILDVVKDFEQRNADQNARHDVIAVPPERYARDQEHQLHWTWSLSANPRPDVICKKQSRNCDRHRQQPLLRSVEECRRDERSTGRIIGFECIGHSLRRKQDSSDEPDSAQCEIQTTR